MSARDVRRLAVVLAWAVGAACITWRSLSPSPSAGSDQPVVVTHWANGHIMTDPLLVSLAARFNAEDHRTSAGRHIEVRTYLVNSGVITEDLIARINPTALSIECKAMGCVNPRELPDPVVVTPAADHWLSQLNFEIGREVVDVAHTESIATSRIGIVTLREMAQCLGWPSRQIGFADVLALRASERGWESCRTAKAEWGSRPLISFTDPRSSTTGRGMLYALYAMAAGKPPGQLDESDVASPDVVGEIKRFQAAIDHYAPDSLILNHEVYAAPSYGHFFFMAEDNLVQLYEGKAPGPSTSPGLPARLDRDMVMIYPKEGSLAHTHPAGIVEAAWVTPEENEGARQWIAFLHAAPQQAAFLEEGLRPAASIPVSCPVCPRFGLDPNPPVGVIDLNQIDPAVREAIVGSWGEVKTPGVITFVVDNSAAMAGANLEQTKQGIIQMLDSIDQRTLVGLITFSDQVTVRAAPRPVADARFVIRDAVDTMRAEGGSALYDAIREGLDLTDAAAAESGAIRGVVVLSAAPASAGAPADSLLRLVSRASRTPVHSCGDADAASLCEGASGATLTLDGLDAEGWTAETRNRVHVFSVGIGPRADLELGRLLAEATPGSSFARASDEEIRRVIDEFSAYF